MCLDLWRTSINNFACTYQTLWEYITTKYSMYDILWYICSYWHHTDYISQIESYFNNNPKIKFCLLNRLSDALRRNVYSYLNLRDWQLFSNLTSKYTSVYFAGDSDWLEIWRAIQCIEESPTHIFQKFQEIIGNPKLLEIFIFDKRIILKDDFIHLQKIIKDNKKNTDTPTTSNKPSNIFTLLDFLYHDLVIHLVQYLDFVSYCTLRSVNYTWYVNLSQFNCFVNIPAFHKLIVDCNKDFKFDRGISSLFLWQFCSKYEFWLKECDISMRYKRGMPLWSPLWLQSYSGDVWNLFTQSKKCQFVENLWLTKIKYYKSATYTLGAIDRWFITDNSPNNANFLIDCKVFVAGTTSFSTCNLYRLCCHSRCQIMVFWYATIYDNIINFNNNLDVATYHNTCNKHWIIIGNNESKYLQVINRFQWFNRRVSKFTGIWSQWDESTLKFLNVLLNCTKFAKLKDIHLFHYQKQNESHRILRLFLWLDFAWEIIHQRLIKFNSFKCTFITGDKNESLGVVSFDIMKLVTLNQLEQYRITVTTMYDNNNYRPSNVNAITDYNNTIKLFL